MMIKPTYVVSMAEIHDIHVACGVIILEPRPVFAKLDKVQ